MEVLPSHDAVLSGDELASLTVNYKWRSIIAAAVEYFYRDYYATEDELDNQDAFAVFLEDLYSYEDVGSAVKVTNYAIVLSGNKTTSSATYVDIAEISQAHVFEHSKAEIEVILRLENAANANASSRVILDGSAGIGAIEARVRQMVEPVKVVDRWSGITTGVSKTIKAQFKSSSGTITVYAGYNVIIRVFEYD